MAHNLCFGEHRFATTAIMSNSTLGIIKPHAVLDGQLGAIVSDIQAAGLTIAAMHSFTLDRANAEEFLEVYKVRLSLNPCPSPQPDCALQGVVPEYISMVTELESGVSVALELVGGSDVYGRFRQLCGPMGTLAACWLAGRAELVALVDPEVARHLRPNTLRAKYGLNKVQSAIHCTDLPEDCSLETEYFFGILLE